MRWMDLARGVMAPTRKNPLFVILKNVGVLTAVNLLGRLLNFAIVAIVARTAGPDGLGGYATATAVASLFLIAADFGLGPRLVREASRDARCTDQVYAHSMSVKTLTSLVVCLLLVASFFFLPYEPWVRDLLLLFSISWLIRSYTQLNNSVIRARERMELEAASVLVQSVVFITGALGCLYLRLSLVALGWAAIVAALAQLFVSILLARRLASLRVELRPHWATLRDSAPYGAALLTYTAFMQSYVVVLSLIASQTLVGEFTSVSRILVLASVFPELLNLATLPATSRVFGQSDPARFRRFTTASLRIFVILAGAGAVALVSISKPLLRVIYGEELAFLFPLLQLGALYLVLQFARSATGRALVASGRQRSVARATLIALVSSIVLVLALTPPFGVLGAVLAMVLGELVLAVAIVVPARDLLDKGDAIRNAAWVLAAGGLAVALHFWIGAAGHPISSVVVPVLSFPLLLLPSGEFGKLYHIARDR